jgi:ribosomal protein S18 acetylase RimI-like enzyme
MTEGAPRSAPRRPESARPRQDVEQEDGMAPPSQRELEAIERSQVDWARLLGAEVVEDEELRAVLIHHTDPGPDFNLTARIRWRAADVPAKLLALQERMRVLDRWPSIVYSEGLSEPNDLTEQLEAAGWKRVAGERIMFTRHAPVVPHLDPGLRVEAVTKATAIDTARLEAEAFGQTPGWIPSRAELLARAVESGAIRAFLLRLVKEPVATLRLAPGDRVAGIHGVGVAARHRRRGYGRMITAVATRAGLVTGHGLVWLSVDEANTAAVELYRSLGYEPSIPWSRWVAPAR